MQRGIVVALIIGCLCACGAGAWMTRNALIAPFVLPGASDLVVTPQGINGISIAYHADGQPFAWTDQLTTQLKRMDWNGRSYSFIGSRTPFILMSFAHEMELGPLIIVEQAVVGGSPDDPNAVQVRVHHELHLRH